MAEHGDRLERLSDLLFLLLESPPLTQTQIRAELGLQSATAYPDGDSGERAFFRDLATLRAEDIPVIEEDDSYTVRPEDYYLPDLDLSQEARVALNLAATAVAFDGHRWSESAAWKLGGLLADQELFGIVRSPESLTPMFDACAQRRAVRFTHSGKERVVDAWALLLREGHSYLTGHYRDAGTDRYFRLDRVAGKVTDAGPWEHEPPSDFDPSAGFPTDPKLVGGEEPVVAEVEVDALVATRVIEQHRRAEVVDRRDDGAVVVRLQVTNRDAFRSWLLGMLDHARVLAPDELVDDVRSWLQAIADGGES